MLYTFKKIRFFFIFQELIFAPFRTILPPLRMHVLEHKDKPEVNKSQKLRDLGAQ